jgi:phage gpG-like protein
MATPEENMLFLGRLQDRAESAAAPVANGFAQAFSSQVANVTLRQIVHPPAMFWKAVPGEPPAYATGALARSVIPTYTQTPVFATSLVGAYSEYAALQEWGGATWPNHHKFMHWINSGGSWYKKRVVIPEHPYFRPTLTRLILDGSFTRSAMSDFMLHMTPIF